MHMSPVILLQINTLKKASYLNISTTGNPYLTWYKIFQEPVLPTLPGLEYFKNQYSLLNSVSQLVVPFLFAFNFFCLPLSMVFDCYYSCCVWLSLVNHWVFSYKVFFSVITTLIHGDGIIVCQYVRLRWWFNHNGNFKYIKPCSHRPYCCRCAQKCL
jgi:hypothetical protein